MAFTTTVADTAGSVVQTVAAAWSTRPVLACWLGGVDGEAGRALLAHGGLPTYDTPESAVTAFMRLVRLLRAQSTLLQTPTLNGETPAPRNGRRIVDGAIAEGRTALTAIETLELLRTYGVRTIERRTARTPEDAAAAATAMGGTVALKIVSAAITHKSDVGGVVLCLTAPQVEAEARAMLARVRAAKPDAEIDGFMVEPMVARDAGVELLVGLSQDPVFGPVVLFGQGGVSAEVVADRAIGIPPLDDVLAHDVIGRTRVSRLLGAMRGRPAANMDAVAAVLVALSRIAVDLPEIKELDINPLIAGSHGAVALDARAAIQPAASAARPAIAPYPNGLVRNTMCGELPVVIRPIRSDDAPRLIELVDKCTAEDVFFRFGVGMKHLSPELAQQLSHIDYDRHMALAAEGVDDSLLGVARVTDDLGGETGEFVLLVRSDVHGQAIGRTLLQALIDYAAARGMTSIWSDTELENGPMIDLARHLGFTTHLQDGGVRVSRTLSPWTVAAA